MAAPVGLTQLSSNWRKLQEKLRREQAGEKKSNLKRKRSGDHTEDSKRIKMNRSKQRPVTDADTTNGAQPGRVHKAKSHSMLRASAAAAVSGEGQRPATSHQERESPPQPQVNEGVSPTAMAGRYIALDCEMVGVGPEPDKDSQLARVSIVNYHGHQLYDSYVKPLVPVTDYRTHVSGIRPHHMKIARPFKEVQADVATFLKGRVLVGHAVKNDLRALMLSHPKKDTRDTSKHAAYRSLAKGAPSLKRLASELLGLEIQVGEHSSIEDARACMLLYRREKDVFEANASNRLNVPYIAGPVEEHFPAQQAKKNRKRKVKR